MSVEKIVSRGRVVPKEDRDCHKWKEREEKQKKEKINENL